jgi:hypothetical protein
VAARLPFVLGCLSLTVLTGCLAKDSGRPVGDRCSGDGECQSGLHCVYGRCRQPCTFDRDCGAGAACVPSADDPSLYVCTLPDEQGGTTCPMGLGDDGTGMCRRPCETDGPEPNLVCGPSQSCAQGWCRRADSADGGVPGSGDGSVDGGGGDRLDWVPIPGGNFDMGSGSGDEGPVHEVNVPSFQILRTEVTVAQYLVCVAAGACSERVFEWPECNWNVPSTLAGGAAVGGQSVGGRKTARRDFTAA